MRWKTVKLGEVVEIVKGKKPAVVSDIECPEAPLPYVTIEAFEYRRPVQYASIDDNAVLLNDGDVVIVWDGARYGMIGAAIAGVLGSTLAALRPDAKVLDKKFLQYYLITKNDVLRATQRGSGIPHLDNSTVKSLPIPLPPLSEQRRIVEILDQADALRRKRREANALAERILPALFYKMFGDPVRNEKGWEIVEIRHIADVKGGKRLPKGSDYSGEPTPFRYIRVTDIQPNVINRENLKFLFPETQAEISRYTVDLGDVVITIAGKIGVTAPIVDEDLAGVNLTENAAKIVPKEEGTYDPVYLSAYLNLPTAQADISGHIGRVTIEKLALFRIEKLRVLLPPIELQKAFRSLAGDFYSMINSQRHSDKITETLFQSLLHRAFTGELTEAWSRETADLLKQPTEGL